MLRFSTALGISSSLVCSAAVFLCLFSAGDSSLSRDADRVVVFQSARNTSDRLSEMEPVTFGDVLNARLPLVDVSAAETMGQEVVGFGGAFTEASALLFQNLTAENQQALLEKYFDAETGIGYTLGRVHINSCDFSPVPGSWSEDEVVNDSALEHFDTEVNHDSGAMIPFIKAAMERIEAGGRKLKLFASPWSPPAWMKTTGKMVGGGSLRPEFRGTWARYIAKWITAYKAKGVPLWGLTPQNEPENSASWEACRYTAEEEADWLGEHLGPTLNATHPEVLIFAYDHNKDHVYDWAKVMYAHPTAPKYIDGIALHWYTGDSFDNVAKVHVEFPQAALLATEATWEKYRWQPGTTAASGEWAFGEGYAHDIVGDLNAGAVGWTDWNLLLDTTGGPNHVGNNCDAPMYSENGTALYLHPQYYYIGHFSKFILPGSRRIVTNVIGSKTYQGAPRGYGTCTEEDGLQATAFERPDGRVVIVALNCGPSSSASKTVSVQLR